MDVCRAEPGQTRTIPLFWSMVESRAGFGVVVVVVVGEGGVSSVATVLSARCVPRFSVAV